MKIKLYSGTRNASSWAFRAWLALTEQEIEFDEIIVDIRRPQRWANLAKIGEFSPPAEVPVLVDNDVVIFDSMAIMEYANDIGKRQLLPTDTKSKAQARSWLAWQHTSLGKICPSLSFESTFYKIKKQLSQQEVKQAIGLYNLWEQQLKKSDTPYLFGNLSLADLSLIPTILRLNSHLPVPNHFPLTLQWTHKLINRPNTQQWLKEAYQLEPIYCEGYNWN